MTICDQCNGTGWDERDAKICPWCNGIGEFPDDEEYEEEN